jgi:pyruvate dehydrogenase E2 component (dihydrolipoamide acetyltransferase)
MTAMQGAEVLTSGKGEPQLTKLPLMRRAMVRQMLQGAAVPCFYLRVSADVTELLELRSGLKQGGGGAAPSVNDHPVPSVNDFIIRAVGIALRRHPEVNASFTGEQIAAYPRVNVGVAVAIPDGLVVPAVYDADERDVYAIAASVREVVGLAERRKLNRELLEDTTFTVSNLGMHGIEDFDPLINPPHAAILGIGAALAGGDGRRRMRLTLGCDHRVLTGTEGAPFLTGVRDLLERPAELLGTAANREE